MEQNSNSRSAIYGLVATTALIAGSIILAAVAVQGLQLIFGF